MPGCPVHTHGYSQLLAGIREEIERGLKAVEELIDRQKVLSYWAIGRRINGFLNARDLPRGGVGRFYSDLSRDTGIHNRTLQQCEQFFRYFPRLKPRRSLKWSHYRFLLVEPDADRRTAWMERIIRENMPADQLRLALMPPREKGGPAVSGLKTPVRGKLFTYRILRAGDIDHFVAPWFVDIGFSVRIEAPPCRGVLDNKYIYTSEKTGGVYRLKSTGAKADALYTFRAKLRRVIDGDTLLVMVDQGFGCWTEQRLRLNGIDAPELGTLAGQRSKKWIEDELEGAGDLVVKTYKSDKWDRYLTDVFYRIPGKASSRPKGTAGPKDAQAAEAGLELARVACDGAWLNGRLVAAGMADVYKSTTHFT